MPPDDRPMVDRRIFTDQLGCVIGFYHSPRGGESRIQNVDIVVLLHVRSQKKKVIRMEYAFESHSRINRYLFPYSIHDKKRILQIISIPVLLGDRLRDTFRYLYHKYTMICYDTYTGIRNNIIDVDTEQVTRVQGGKSTRNRL